MQNETYRKREEPGRSPFILRYAKDMATAELEEEKIGSAFLRATFSTLTKSGGDPTSDENTDR